jgi:hypothetical protein
MKDEDIIEIERLQSAVLLSRGTYHQLGNHLTLISGYASLLKMNLTPGSEDHELMAKIDKAVREMSSLLDDSHVFVRGRPANRASTNICALVKDVEHLLSRTFPRLTVKLDLPPHRVLATCDTRRIFDAIMHVCLNAKDAMDGQGTVTLSALRLTPDLESSARDGHPELPAGGIVSIAIEDQGPGFAEPIPSPPFEPRNPSLAEGGRYRTGLGLAAVDRILRSHGGLLEVANTHEGGGRIRLLLPA